MLSLECIVFLYIYIVPRSKETRRPESLGRRGPLLQAYKMLFACFRCKGSILVAMITVRDYGQHHA